MQKNSRHCGECPRSADWHCRSQQSMCRVLTLFVVAGLPDADYCSVSLYLVDVPAFDPDGLRRVHGGSRGNDHGSRRDYCRTDDCVIERPADNAADESRPEVASTASPAAIVARAAVSAAVVSAVMPISAVLIESTMMIKPAVMTKSAVMHCRTRPESAARAWTATTWTRKASSRASHCCEHHYHQFFCFAAHLLHLFLSPLLRLHCVRATRPDLLTKKNKDFSFLEPG